MVKNRPSSEKMKYNNKKVSGDVDYVLGFALKDGIEFG